MGVILCAHVPHISKWYLSFLTSLLIFKVMFNMVLLELVKVAPMCGGAMMKVIMNHVVHNVTKQTAGKYAIDIFWEDYVQQAVKEEGKHRCRNWRKHQSAFIKRGLHKTKCKEVNRLSLHVVVVVVVVVVVHF